VNTSLYHNDKRIFDKYFKRIFNIYLNIFLISYNVDYMQVL